MRGVVRERVGSGRGGCVRERWLRKGGLCKREVAQGELDKEFGRERKRARGVSVSVRRV